MDKYDVFISYSRKDEAVVHEVARQLQARGFEVWIDWDGIASGDYFKRKITKAILESKILLFFMSYNSNQSEWTEKEINLAVEYDKDIIPVRLDNTKYNIGIAADLVGRDYVDLTDVSRRNVHLEKLYKSLAAKCGKQLASPAAAPKRPVQQPHAPKATPKSESKPTPAPAPVGKYRMRVKAVGQMKFQIARLLKDNTDFTIEEATQWVNNPPFAMICPDRERAEKLAAQFKEYGATVEVVPVHKADNKPKVFGVYLKSAGPSKLAVVKLVKELFRLDLKDAKNYVDRAPVKIPATSKLAASNAASALRGIGADAVLYEE